MGFDKKGVVRGTVFEGIKIELSFVIYVLIMRAIYILIFQVFLV